jgi:hypothetical protein
MNPHVKAPRASRCTTLSYDGSAVKMYSERACTPLSQIANVGEPRKVGIHDDVKRNAVVFERSLAAGQGVEHHVLALNIYHQLQKIDAKLADAYKEMKFGRSL